MNNAFVKKKKKKLKLIVICELQKKFQGKIFHLGD